MRKEAIEALRVYISSLTQFTILKPGRVTAIEMGSEEIYNLMLSECPAILLDYRATKRQLQGGKSARFYNGRIIVAVNCFDLDDAEDELSDYITIVLDRLYRKGTPEDPLPQYDSTPIWLKVGESSPYIFKENEDKSFFLAEQIPCNLEWKY